MNSQLHYMLSNPLPPNIRLTKISKLQHYSEAETSCSNCHSVEIV